MLTKLFLWKMIQNCYWFSLRHLIDLIRYKQFSSRLCEKKLILKIFVVTSKNCKNLSAKVPTTMKISLTISHNMPSPLRLFSLTLNSLVESFYYGINDYLFSDRGKIIFLQYKTDFEYLDLENKIL